MNTARLLTVLAAASLAGVAYAQTQPPPPKQPSSTPPPAVQATPGNNMSSPSSASSPHQHHALRMAEASSAGAHSWANMPVESASGQSLGSVSSVVPGLNGHKTSGYVVVAGANGASTPVPYRTASAMVHDGKLILSQSRFERAPTVTQGDLQNSSAHAWRLKADRYWMAKSHGWKHKKAGT
ncbi:MAG: hypothetical protein ACREUL_01230 [Steroidobacteraceae bacterium]